VTVPSGVVLPVGGAIVEPLYLLHERSLGENPIHSWTNVGSAIGVVPFLEASLLEIGFGLRQCCVANGEGRRPWVGVARWVVVARRGCVWRC
jgi:hypothetical protein